MSKLSRDERFKIWRSKQSYFMNTLIGIALFIKDMIVFMLMGILFFIVVVAIILFIVQQTGNAFSGQ